MEPHSKTYLEAILPQLDSETTQVEEKVAEDP